MSVTYQGITFDRLGHASVRLEADDGTVIYIDPWTEVLDREPNDADVVFVTHDDFDHYDPEAIEAVATSETTIAAYEAIETSNLHREIIALSLDGEKTVAGIDVRSVPAYNDPDGGHVDENDEPFHADGEVIGLLLTIDGTEVFFPSDTDFLPHHESVSADVFIPPIGGHYTMNRHEAAAFAESVDPDLVLPVHYDTFDAIETDVEAFAADVEERGSTVEVF